MGMAAMTCEMCPRCGRARAEVLGREPRAVLVVRLVRRSDFGLGQLEEMDRGGVAPLPDRRQAAIADKLAEMPEPLRRLYCADGSVQCALDSLFEMQRALFKARHPEFDYGELDELDPD